MPPLSRRAGRRACTRHAPSAVRPRSPRVVGGSVERRQRRARVDVDDAEGLFRRSLGRGGLLEDELPRIDRLGERIERDLPDVLVLDQDLERRGVVALVGLVLVEAGTEGEEVLPEGGLLGLDRGVQEHRDADRREDADDRHDDEQLYEREAAAPGGREGVGRGRRRALRHGSEEARHASPVLVLRAVQTRLFGKGVDVVDVLPPPAGRVGVVLQAPKPPLRLSRHRVDWNPPEKLPHFLDLPHQLDPLHERLELLRVPFGRELDRDQPLVGEALVLVDGRAHRPERLLQLDLLHPRPVEPCHGDDHRRQHEDQRDDDDELDERVAAGAGRGHPDRLRGPPTGPRRPLRVGVRRSFRNPPPPKSGRASSQGQGRGRRSARAHRSADRRRPSSNRDRPSRDRFRGRRRGAC